MPFLRKKKQNAEEVAAKAAGSGGGRGVTTMMSNLTSGDTITAIKSVLKPETEEAKAKPFLDRIEGLPQAIKSDFCLKSGAVCLLIFFIISLSHVASVTKASDVKAKRQVVVSMDGDPGDYLALEYLLQREDTVLEMIILNGNGWSSSLAAFTNSMDNFFDSRQQAIGATAASQTRPPVYYGASFASAAGNTNCTYRCVIDPVVLLGHDAAWNTPNVVVDPLASDGHDISLNGDSVAANIQLYASPLYNLLEASHGGVDFLALGPLTDLAWYFEAHPTHGRFVGGLKVDGGSFVVGQGNMAEYFPQNTGSEWNLFFDPAAAKYLLERTATQQATTPLVNFPVTLFPLDASRRCSVEDVSLYRAAVGDGKNQWLSSLMDNYATARAITSNVWPLSNPLLVAAYTAAPAVIPAQSQWLQVEVADPKALQGVGSSVSATNTMLETAGSVKRASSLNEASAAIQGSTVMLHFECANVLAHLQAVAAL